MQISTSHLLSAKTISDGGAQVVLYAPEFPSLPLRRALSELQYQNCLRQEWVSQQEAETPRPSYCRRKM